MDGNDELLAVELQRRLGFPCDPGANRKLNLTLNITLRLLSSACNLPCK